MTPEVLRAYFDYRLFGVYKPYMKVYTDRPEYNAFLDPVSCDLHYGLEDQIRSDSLSYYETYHYRPHLARAIMTEVCGQPD